jgi:radial spoke head protein 9
MDSQSLHQTVDFVSGCGVILSTEQKASLQTSLAVLLKRNKFSHVHFWGKILGIHDDYYIAQGFTKDQLSGKKTLFSKDCLRWALLSEQTEETCRLSGLLQTRFTGDPSFRVALQDTVLQLKEEDRLAAVVAQIDHEVALVPRGSLVLSPRGSVRPNRHFDGHSLSEALKLSSYVHARPMSKGRIVSPPTDALTDWDCSVDFMDGVQDDLPPGCWCVQHERAGAGGVVTLKSLLWPGYVCYQLPDTRQHGAIYIGTGLKNIDLAFML